MSNFVTNWILTAVKLTVLSHLILVQVQFFPLMSNYNLYIVSAMVYYHSA